MKVALNKKMSSRNFSRAPINFWEPPKVEEDSLTKIVYEEHVCHEVKYDPSDKDSESYKKYMKPFSYRTAKQWLKFMEDLNVVICGNGLNNNGPGCFKLTHSSLKGEALHVFNDKAAEQKEEMRDTHVQCLCTITAHVFPKDNPLLKQKTYMRNQPHVPSLRTISEFHARWYKLNNYVDEFMLFGPNQHFTENQMKDILYNILIPKHWQSYLQRYKFDLNKMFHQRFL
jgi:hypothetical protein